MEVVQKYWKVIDEFFESITPSVEPVKKVQEKIPFPIRYILMAVVAIFAVVFYLCTRKCCFFGLCAFFCGLIGCMVSFANNEHQEQKWAGFWILYALCQMAPARLTKNFYFVVIRCLTLMYFALCNDCSIFITALKKCYEFITTYFDMYKSKYCVKDKKD